MEPANKPIEKFDVYVEEFMKMAIKFGPKLVLAIIVLIIGLSVIKSINNFLRHVFIKRELDPTLTPFIINLVSWIFKALLLVSVASMVGIETTSFVAMLGAAGLAVGLALQGSLSNLSGGVLILMFRPFKQGDTIEAQGQKGTVDTIDIFSTIVRTPDNKKIIIPNGPLVGGTITNYTSSTTRRVDLKIGIGYSDDVKKASQLLLNMCKNHPLVLAEPAPFVGVDSYGDNSINLVIRPWSKTEDYSAVYYQLNEQIKEILDANKISIPGPQREIRIVTGDSTINSKN